MKRIQIQPVLGLALPVILCFGFQSCKKSGGGGGGNNPLGICFVKEAPSYFGTQQSFQYNDKHEMTSRTYSFGNPYYTDYLQTLDAKGSVYSYSYKGTKVTLTEIYTGGTGNFFDGTATQRITREKDSHADGTSLSIALDTIGFAYDSKKRLSIVTHRIPFYSSYVPDYYVRHQSGTYLSIQYDDNDNATLVRQVDVFQQGVYNVNNPSESSLYADSVVRTQLRMTYDDHPSPFITSLKYWIFIQDDFGEATNSNWSAIITALSAHNPLTIHWEVQSSAATDHTDNMTYNYTAEGLPSDHYTYDCDN